MTIFFNKVFCESLPFRQIKLLFLSDICFIMIVAQQKKKENTAEYLLYMWQVEDLIRACGFDMQQIDANVISRFAVNDDVRRQIYEWYDNLRLMMLNEHLEKAGHLQINKNVLNELEEWHLSFLQSDWEYQAKYQRALPVIAEFRTKNAADGAQDSDMELCFNLLYMTMLMRMQQKPLSASTEEAIKTVSDMLRTLLLKIKRKEEESMEKTE